MLVLGLDTATPASGVVVAEVLDDGAVRELARRSVVDARRAGEVLTPLITEALRAAGRRPGDLEAIVSGVGPGPYTSLRVGIVTAAALADALSIPAFGVCSLDGYPTDGRGPVTVVTDARRREVYWARYVGGERTDGPGACRAADLVPTLAADERAIGAGAELYADVFGAAFDPEGARYPDPLLLIDRGRPAFGSVPGPLVPLYLRRPDATPRRAA